MSRSGTLFLVSTPLHLFVSAGVALARRQKWDAHLVFIDQPPGQEPPYLSCVREWRESPFQSVHVLPTRGDGLVGRLQGRRHAFRLLRELVDGTTPRRIHVGNDRRVEFQYAMHHARTVGIPCEGVYLDEGAYTYLGRPPQQLERVVDHRLKRLAYGSFWDTPPTVGGSRWVDRALVAHPDEVFGELRGKELEAVPARWFWDPALVALARGILRRFTVDVGELRRCDTLLTVPHEKVLRRQPDLREDLAQVVRTLLVAGEHVAVKSHPRSGGDPLQVAGEPGVFDVPHQACFEALLPVLDTPRLIGGGFSPLMTTRWLRPDLRSIGLLDGGLEGTRAGRLLESFGVELLHSSRLVSPDEEQVTRGAALLLT